MTEDVTFPKSEVLTVHSKLASMMEEHKFDSRMLNMAVLKNARTLEDEAEKMRQGKQEIFSEYAAVWGEDEDLPDDVEPGQMKVQELPGGRSIPQFKSEDAAERASEELNDLFEGSLTFTLKVVPEEAMDLPDGGNIDFWARLEWMFVDNG